MPNIRKTFNFRDGVQVDDSVLVVKGDRVGIGTTVPEKSLDVRGNAQVVGIITADNSIISGVGTFGGVKLGSGITLDASSGVITATKFKGDGSTLSNLPTSQWVDIDVGLGFTSIYNAGGNVGIHTNDPRSGLQIGGNVNATPQQSGVGISSLGDIKATGIVTAIGGFSGELTGNVIGNVTGTASNATLAATATVATNAQGLTGTPDITVRNINSAGISTLATLSSTDFTVPTLKGYSTLRGIHGSTTTFAVTVASKTSAHRYNGQGGSNAFLIDGVQAPFLILTPGRTYRFDLSDGSTATHPFRFYYDADRTTQYTTGITVAGTQGSAGAYQEILVSDTTPTVLHYGCQTHALMGNGIQTNSNVLDTEHDSTVRGTMTATSFVGEINATRLDSNASGVIMSGVTTVSSIEASGNVEVSGELTIADKITHASDTNTNIRFPANDTIAFETSGSERVRIDSSGNLNVVGIVTAASFVFGNLTSANTSIGVATATSLGIGTATANSKIQIVDSSASSLVIGKGGAVGVNNLELRYGGGASRFSTANALDLINHGDGHFNYFLKNTAGNSFVWHKGNANELMTLTDGGSLGIGVTVPTHKLTVDGTSKITGVATFSNAVFIDGVLTVQDATISNLVGNVTGSLNSSSGVSTVTHLKATSSIGIGMTGSGNAFSVHTGEKNRFSIDNDGNVGIRTTILTPNIELDVQGDAKFHHGIVVGVTTGLCAVDFSGTYDITADNSSRAALSYMLPPKVSTAQRGTLSSRTGGPVPSGAIIYNISTNKLQVWNGSSWNDCF